MPKTRKIMDFCDQGRCFQVIRVYGEKDFNPYYLYEIYNAPNKYGYITQHRKRIVKYANMASVFYWFLQNNIGF